MENCVNHPERKSFSKCHGCGKHYCQSCLDEGKEYYYCKKPECQKLLQVESPIGILSPEIICPSCSNNIILSDSEKKSRKVHCPECESFLDYSVDPPKVITAEKYTELLSSMNQGDIGLIKSILENSNIDYYIFGENFLSVEPLVQPARIFVHTRHIKEAKELLKDFDLNIFGASSRTEMDE
ncbi:hypothetical protein C0389_08475 [bacterium]|nr:hypothetical protein [bacterium]